MKIRGLWRGGSSDYIDHQYPRHYSQPQQPPPPVPHTSSNHHHPGTSSGREARIQIAYDQRRTEDIRSPARDPPPPPPITSSSTNLRPPYYPASSVYVKKDMGRDPGSSEDCETCRITLQSSSDVVNNDRHSSPPPPPPQQLPIELTATTRPPPQPLLPENQNYSNAPPGANAIMSSFQGAHNITKGVKTFYPQTLIIPEAPSIDPSTSSRPQFSHLADRERPIIHRTPNPPPFGNNNPSRPHLPPENVNIATIKQEPQDWSPDEYEQKPHVDVVPVKREVIYREEEEERTGSGGEETSCNINVHNKSNPMYTPLSCELCQETFTVPGEWVRHIENHAETPQTVPKKRRRTEVRVNGGMGFIKLIDDHHYCRRSPRTWPR